MLPVSKHGLSMHWRLSLANPHILEFYIGEDVCLIRISFNSTLENKFR
jgi:hypothetical protein